MPDVVRLTTEQTHPLRRIVLRVGTPTTEVNFAEDHLSGTIHLGVYDGETLVATSTWAERECPARPLQSAVQLRGMATLQSHQGLGLGASLVAAGCEHARSVGAAVVWANARDQALSFYEANGFSADGDGFVDVVTQLPHHLVLRSI